MKKILFVLILVLVYGCAHLRPDASKPSIEAGYPQMEFHYGDKVFNGLGIASVTEGFDLSSLNLSVQTYYTGTITIESKNCGISLSRIYSDFEFVKIPLTGSATKSCLISVVINPKYNEQNKDPIEVFGFQGHFALKVIKKLDSWTGLSKKVTGKFSEPMSFNVGGSGPVRVVFGGCGVDFDKQLLLNDKGILVLDLNQLVELQNKSLCVLEGVIVSPEYQDLLINVLVSQYDSSFIPLPEPLITQDGTDLVINGDDTVSVVSLDSDYQMENSAKFLKFDSTLKHVSRVFTVKGRLVVCVWGEECKR